MAVNQKERIVFDVAYQPQVRTATDTGRLMRSVIFALLPAVAVSIWQFGLRALLMIAVSVASAVFFEWAYRKLLKKSATIIAMMPSRAEMGKDSPMIAAISRPFLSDTPKSPWRMPFIYNRNCTPTGLSRP